MLSWRWSLSSGDMTLRAFNFNKLWISLNLDASNFSCPFPTAHHTPHHSCLWVWALPRKIVFRHQKLPSIQLVKRCRVLSGHGVGTPVHDRLRFRIKLGFNWKHCQVVAGGYQQIRRGRRRGLHQADCPHELRLVSGRHLHELACLIDCFPPHPVGAI